MISEKQKASHEEVRHIDEKAGEVLLTQIDPEKEKKLVRKIDLHLIPILCLLLLCTFLEVSLRDGCSIRPYNTYRCDFISC